MEFKTGQVILRGAVSIKIISTDLIGDKPYAVEVVDASTHRVYIERWTLAKLKMFRAEYAVAPSDNTFNDGDCVTVDELACKNWTRCYEHYEPDVREGVIYRIHHAGHFASHIEADYCEMPFRIPNRFLNKVQTQGCSDATRSEQFTL